MKNYFKIKVTILTVILLIKLWFGFEIASYSLMICTVIDVIYLSFKTEQEKKI